MSDNSFKVKNSLVLTPVDLATLTNPQAGDLACDINDSNKIKRYDELSASWTEVGSGAAGDVDTLLVQDFDSASLSSFTQTGLELITLNPLDGRQSARLVHQAASTRSFKQTIAVPPKFRGVNMTASLLLRSSASQGNVTIQFRDETNSVDYPSQQLQTNSQVIASLVTNSTTLVSGFSNSNINSLKVGMSVTGSGIPTGTTIASINSSALTITLSQAATASATVSLRFSDLPRTIQLGFNIPANCSSYSYTISALQEAGSPETYVDDIVLKNYWIGMSNQGQSEILVPSIEQQNIIVVPSSNVTNSNILGSPLTSVGSGLFSYNSVTGVYTVLKQSNFNLHMSGRTTTAATSAFQIFVDEINVSQMDTVVGSGYEGNASYSAILNAGSTFRFYCSGSPSNSAETRSSVSATAITTSSVIVNDIVPSKAVLGNTAIDVPNVTGWQGYTPTFQGFGSPTNVEFEWRQVGENVEIRGKFTGGTSTAVEARIGLPAGLTSAGTSLIPSIQIAGIAISNDIGASSTFFTLIEPSVSYVTFGVRNTSLTPLSKQNGNAVSSNGVAFTVNASIPCAGLSATEEVVVSGTQSALVQESDSAFRIDGALGYGSTGTTTLRFNTANIRENVGSDITYTPSSINGDSFIVNSSGIYSISADAVITGGSTSLGITKNSSSTSTSIATIATNNSQQVLTFSTDIDTTYNNVENVSWSGYLTAGDIIRVQTNGTAIGTASYFRFSISKQGSLKQLNVSSDQKITIPTSELRFEGASSRGSTATAIVKFDTLAKLRGDAFTVESDAVLGTRITMNKAGRLSVAVNLLYTNSQATYISKNQSVLSNVPTVSSEILTYSQTGGTGGNGQSSSWTGDVIVGDIIRISAQGTPTATVANNLSLSFQEQEIQVSVSNTLPQFSDSDSSIRVDTANGYGSTANNKIRRFSNIRDNIGSDIEYVADSANGASFTVKSSGIYHISYTESTLSFSLFGLSRNSSQLTTSIASINVTDRLAMGTTDSSSSYPETVSWTGYLNAEDVIRPHTDGGGATGTADRAQFTISKVGKPNVTGVDVTPFVNIPQNSIQVIEALNPTATFGSTNTGVPVLNITRNSNNGIIAVESTSTTGTSFRVLKRCSIYITANASSSNNGSAAAITRNSTTLLTAGFSTTTALSISSITTGYTGELSANTICEVGDILRIQRADALTSNYTAIITATALSDQILTAPETFSTDTASLRYANASEYTLSTLQNAPVGTYITFTYAANTNTRTQTTLTNRPSQTDADMNVNGILLYTRAYNAASTAGNPAVIAIQIGKGLKGKSLDLYKSAGKVTAGNLIYYTAGNVEYGAYQINYNEITGILYIDLGITALTTNTVHSLFFSDNTSQTSGYLVINASKNPSLTGMNQNVVAARVQNTAGIAVSGGTDSLVTMSASEVSILSNMSINYSNSSFVIPETGIYFVKSAIQFASATTAAAASFSIKVYKNGVYYSTIASKTVDANVTAKQGLQGADDLLCQVGDYIQFYVNKSLGTGNTSATPGECFVAINKLSGVN